ncbi:MurT ligase domain-containing protein [Streptomyces sp. NPDC055663]
MTKLHGIASAIRSCCAVQVGRLVAEAYRRSGRPGGTFKAGSIALRISPDVLNVLSSPLDVSLISGTNGKTTTTRLITESLSTHGHVVSNSLGANLPAGIVNAALSAGSDTRAGVMEVDERYLPKIMDETDPKTVVLLNLSRDQLDRTPECRNIASLWRQALSETNATVIANADDPLVVWASSTAKNVVWASVGQRWTDDSWYCPACGDQLERDDEESWLCVSCGLAKPLARWVLRDETMLDTLLGTSHRLQLRLPGLANRANAVMAIAAADVHKVPAPVALARTALVGGVSGRFETFPYRGSRVRLLLAKNPASWLETLELIQDSPEVVLAFNARNLDGLDSSWLWDVDFSSLQNRSVFVMGERRFDLAARLHYDGVAFDLVDSLDEICSFGEHPHLDVVANYTAFLSAITTVRGKTSKGAGHAE